jgi:hypothetical protein
MRLVYSYFAANLAQMHSLMLLEIGCRESAFPTVLAVDRTTSIATSTLISREFPAASVFVTMNELAMSEKHRPHFVRLGAVCFPSPARSYGRAANDTSRK